MAGCISSSNSPSPTSPSYSSPALLLSALLLTLLYESWAFTVAVIGTVLLSTMAVFFGLWLTGTELDISALMGLTMVVGMLTELAIFYLAELPSGEPVTAASLLHAGRARLRPIVMSALIAILTLAPAGAGNRARLGPATAVGDRDHLRPRSRRAAGADDVADPRAALHGLGKAAWRAARARP